MTNDDVEFLDEYKRLDAVCSDMFSCKNGVSRYINEMENQSCRGKFRIFSWDDDFRLLKHLRWVRNKIVHESFDYEVCKSSDIVAVVNFYERIISESDPLSLLRKTETERDDTRSRYKTVLNSSSDCHFQRPLRKKRKSFVIVVIILAIIIAVVYSFVS